MKEYQNIKTFLQKALFQIGLKKFLVKHTVSWACVISDINREKIVGTFYEKELQKTNQKEFTVGKVIKRKDNKLYVTWKGYDNSFSSWIDKKYIVI